MTQTISTITKATLPDVARIAEGIQHAGSASQALGAAASKLGESGLIGFGQGVDVAGEMKTAFSSLVRAEDAVREVAPEAGTLAGRLREHATHIASFTGVYDAAKGAGNLEELQTLKLTVPKGIPVAMDDAEKAATMIAEAAADDAKYSLEDRTRMVAVLNKLDDAVDSLGRVRDGAPGSTTFSSSLDTASMSMLDGREGLRLVGGDAANQLADKLIDSAFDVRRAGGHYAAVERSIGLAADTTGLSTRVKKVSEFQTHADQVQGYLQIEKDAVEKLAAEVADTAKQK
jgi:hypothetical protein